MKRSGKFYRKNEAEVMKALGLKPTVNSGSGWIEKEDGQNDFLICQLKSTDAQSIRINQKDITILEQNAKTVHKVPVFAIQFLNNNSVFLMMRPEDLKMVSEYIETGEITNLDYGIDWGSDEGDVTIIVKDDSIKVSNGADSRNAFYEKRNEKYKKEKTAW